MPNPYGIGMAQQDPGPYGMDTDPGGDNAQALQRYLELMAQLNAQEQQKKQYQGSGLLSKLGVGGGGSGGGGGIISMFGG